MTTDELIALAERVQTLAGAVAGAEGCGVLTLVIAPDGAFQVRGTVSDINQAVGVLQRAVVLMTMGYCPEVPIAVIAQGEPKPEGSTMS